MARDSVTHLRNRKKHVKPVLQALVLAERVWTLDDGRKAICGTFNTIRLTRQAVVDDAAGESGHQTIAGGDGGSPWAYISLTGVCDSTVLKLQFVSLKRNAVIFFQEVTLRSKSRLATVELAIGLPRIAPSESGGYAFDVVCEGEILGSSRIKVIIDEGGKLNADAGQESVDE